LELGAGCGLTGLVAAGLSPSKVVLTDFNPKVLENLRNNIALNNLEATAIGLDFYQQQGDCTKWIDTDGEPHLGGNVVLGADIICQPEDAVAAANTIHDALLPNGLAIVVCADAKHRFGVDRFESECQRMQLNVHTSNMADLYDGQLLNKDMEMTTGYVEGMSLTMFQINHASSRYRLPIWFDRKD
jgi:predicted nicotinamide N-methyase